MKTCIIIPAYKEHKNILRLVKQIKKYINCNIFVVDDSEDNLTKKKLLNISNLVCYHRKKKSGRGSAVLYGIKKNLKKHDIFVEMDADFSHSPKELKRNIKYFKLNKLDLLVSSRYLKKSKITNWPLSRKIFSYLSNKLAQTLLEIPLTDYTNGYRVYSKRSAKLISNECGKIGDGFIVLSEILLKIFKKGYKIDEIDTKFVNRLRGQSSVNFNLIVQSLIGLLKLYLIK